HLQPFRLHCANGCIRPRSSQFYDGPRLNESRVVIDRDSGELEILQCARRLHSVVGVSRNLFRTEKILLRTCCTGGALSRLLRPQICRRSKQQGKDQGKRTFRKSRGTTPVHALTSFANPKST